MDKVRKDMLLAQHTSWLVGGNAEFYLAPESIEEVQEAVLWANEQKQNITVLGGGTNVLISDRGIKGLTLHLGKLQGLVQSAKEDRLYITAHAGTPKTQLLKTFLKYKLPPALFLAGLPGDVGGGVAMNAGVGESIQPREFVEITDWIEVVSLRDAKLRRYTKEELQWDYRKCLGWQPGVIVKGSFSWPLTPDERTLEQVKAANRGRLIKQPLEWPSCGSVFRNPKGNKAGKLIESCGLKGHQIGGAQVSEKHANFIINRGSAKASEIRELIGFVHDKVFEQTGVSLETEVVYMGEWA